MYADTNFIGLYINTSKSPFHDITFDWDYNDVWYFNGKVMLYMTVVNNVGYGVSLQGTITNNILNVTKAYYFTNYTSNPLASLIDIPFGNVLGMPDDIGSTMRILLEPYIPLNISLNKPTVNLAAGWNDVLFLDVPLDNSPANVFKSIANYLDPNSGIWLYKDNNWYSWKPGAIGNDLTAVFPGYVYSIKMAQSATLTIEEFVQPLQIVSLCKDILFQNINRLLGKKVSTLPKCDKIFDVKPDIDDIINIYDNSKVGSMSNDEACSIVKNYDVCTGWSTLCSGDIVIDRTQLYDDVGTSILDDQAIAMKIMPTSTCFRGIEIELSRKVASDTDIRGGIVVELIENNSITGLPKYDPRTTRISYNIFPKPSYFTYDKVEKYYLDINTKLSDDNVKNGIWIVLTSAAYNAWSPPISSTHTFRISQTATANEYLAWKNGKNAWQKDPNYSLYIKTYKQTPTIAPPSCDFIVT